MNLRYADFGELIAQEAEEQGPREGWRVEGGDKGSVFKNEEEHDTNELRRLFDNQRMGARK